MSDQRQDQAAAPVAEALFQRDHERARTARLAVFFSNTMNEFFERGLIDQDELRKRLVKWNEALGD